MAIIIILSIIGLIIGIYITYKNYSSGIDSLFDYILNSIIGVMLGSMIGVIIAISLPMNTYVKKYYSNIEALQDNSGVSGSFFLGCGKIEDKMKYVLYVEENGLFKMVQLDYDLVQIKYTYGEPKVNVSEIYPRDSFINYFAFDFDIHDKTYIIEVPKGTIKNDYNLDAK